MKKALLYLGISAIGFAAGIAFMWIVYGSEVNELTATYCFGKISDDTSLLILIRDKPTKNAAAKLEWDLSANLLFVASAYRSLDSLSTTQMRLLKQAADERAMRPFKTGEPDID